MIKRRLAAGVLLLLLGVVVRFHALGQDVRFHPDEALFVTFARNAAVQGDWLLHGALDKPPLTIYVNALALGMFGVTTLPNGVLTLDVHAGEFAARVPGVFASVLLLAVVFAVARQFYPKDMQRGVAHYAVGVVVMSPLAVAFSATAFTDGLMLLCVTTALWMASRRKWLWGGVWLILGIWCKQQALLYVPLVGLISYGCERRIGSRVTAVKLARFVLPIVVGVALLFAWDGLRGQETSLWTLATVNNDPGRLARPDEIVPRLLRWWQVGQYVFGGSIATVILIIAGGAGWLKQCIRYGRECLTPVDVILMVFVVVYGMFHWLVAINIYDRYLLLILIPLALLVARGLDGLLADWQSDQKVLGVVLLVVTISFPSAWAASDHKLPIGGDSGRHNGIEAVAGYLNQQALGAIVYDHWLGWELGYYMGTWSDKRRVYYTSPDVFANDALLQQDRAPRYFVVPDWADATDWLQALQKAHFATRETYRQAAFTVYELLHP